MSPLRSQAALACRLALTVGLFVACGEPAPRYVPWPETIPDLSFLVLADETRAREIQGPFAEDELPPRLELTLAEDAAWHLVGFEEEHLKAAIPRLPRPPRPPEFGLEPGEELCPLGRASTQAGREQRTVSAWGLQPSLFRLDPLEGRFTPEARTALSEPLVLRATEDPERCLEDVPLGHYHAFGAREALLEGVTELAGLPIPSRAPALEALWDLDLRGVVPLGEDRVLAHTYTALFVVERGEEIAEEPSRYRRLAAEFDGDPAGVLFAIEQVAIDPRTRASAEQRLLVLVSGIRLTSPPRPGRILELTVDAAGLGEVRERWRGIDQVRRVVVEPSGRALAVGERGLVVVLDPDPETPPTEVRLSAGLPWLTQILLTGDPTQPHLVGTEQGELFLGDATSGQMEQISEASAIILGLPTAVEVTTRSGELEILAWPQQPGLRRWLATTGWQPGELSLGMSLAECTSLPNDCGEQQPAGLAYGITSDPKGYDLVATTECDAIFLLDFQARCGRGIFPAGQTRARRSPTDHFRAMTRDGDRHLVVGSNGRIVEFGAR